MFRIARNVMYASQMMYAYASDVCFARCGTYRIILRQRSKTSLFVKQTTSLASANIIKPRNSSGVALFVWSERCVPHNAERDVCFANDVRKCE